MLARTGRPKSENPFDIKYTFRMDKKTEMMLEEICQITGSSKNQCVRDAIKKYHGDLSK